MKSRILPLSLNSLKKRRQFVSNLLTYVMVVAAYLIFSAKLSDPTLNSFDIKDYTDKFINVCVYVCLAISLNLAVGISGELSLGHAGFMTLGAFAGSIVCYWLKIQFKLNTSFFAKLNELHLNPLVIRMICALLVGGVVAGIAGFLIGIPVLRLRGDYLAIVTLAFGEIIYSFIKLMYISIDKNSGEMFFSFKTPDPHGKAILKGATGITGLSAVEDKIATTALAFIVVLITLFIVLNLINSRTGRAIKASRDNRIAAEAMGVNVTKYKMIAFVTSAFLAGVAGALFAMQNTTIKPDKAKFDTSILILVFVVLGGIGSIRGSIISAAILTLLPDFLREYKEYRMLIYAVILILMMIVTNNPTIKSFIRMLYQKALGVFKPLLRKSTKKEVQ